MMRRSFGAVALFVVIATCGIQEFATGLVPFIDGGRTVPKLYGGWFDDQLGKQASAAVSRAVGAGKKKIEVNFPPVPNVEEVKFGTPLNQKFGKTIVAPSLKVPGGYIPGSQVARSLLEYSNIYWAKRLADAVKGGPLGKSVTVLSSEQVNFNDFKSLGSVSETRRLDSPKSASKSPVIAINPGGEENWNRLWKAQGGGLPFVILNPAFSTSYNLGNNRGYEEAYYLKRISKGWIYRSFPGPWEAYLERPDGSVELLESYRQKPELRVIAEIVREESFRRYTISNDRWTKGFGGRL